MSFQLVSMPVHVQAGAAVRRRKLQPMTSLHLRATSPYHFSQTGARVRFTNIHIQHRHPRRLEHPYHYHCYGVLHPCKRYSNSSAYQDSDQSTQDQSSEERQIISSTDDMSGQIDQIARSRKWCRPQESGSFYPIVKEYVNQNLEAKDASSKLFGPIDEAISASRLDDVNFQDLWFSIIHCARMTPFHKREDQERLVNLVAAFKNHSIPDNQKYNYLYSSMTDFGMSCREAYNDSPELDNKYSEVEADAWANLNFFFARITDKGLEDLSLFAIWAMRQALETSPEDELPKAAAQSYDAYTPAAAVWILGMGPILWRKEEDLTPTDSKQGNPARGGDLWKGKAEFSKERWALWKERFVAIAKMNEVSEKTRSLAKDAVEQMERAETFELVSSK